MLLPLWKCFFVISKCRCTKVSGFLYVIQLSIYAPASKFEFFPCFDVNDFEKYCVMISFYMKAPIVTDERS